MGLCRNVTFWRGLLGQVSLGINTKSSYLEVDFMASEGGVKSNSKGVSEPQETDGVTALLLSEEENQKYLKTKIETRINMNSV